MSRMMLLYTDSEGGQVWQIGKGHAVVLRSGEVTTEGLPYRRATAKQLDRLRSKISRQP
jgi:hypothetical protein